MNEGATFGELHPLGGAAELFAEDALGAGRRQVALLRRQPASPAAWSMVDVLAYPTIMPLCRLGVRFASLTL
jgi:hypothetical protein